MSTKFSLANSLDTIEAHLGSMESKLFEWYPKIVVSPMDESLITTEQKPNEFIISGFGKTPL